MSALVEGEPDLQGNLEMMNLAALDMAASLDHFKPPQFADRFRGARNRHLDRIVDALFGRADDLNDAVDVFVHGCLPREPDVVRHPNRRRDNNTCERRFGCRTTSGSRGRQPWTN